MLYIMVIVKIWVEVYKIFKVYLCSNLEFVVFGL